jgi:hypothetical protein
MTVDEALEYADEWAQGMTFHEGSQGWRVACAILALEVRKLLDDTNKLKKENLILNLQLLNTEHKVIEIENKLEGLLLQNELLRNELAREVEVEMKLDRLEKLQNIQDEVEEFIAAHELKNHHYLSDKEIIAEFSRYKKKHVIEAINNLR